MVLCIFQNWVLCLQFGERRWKVSRGVLLVVMRGTYICVYFPLWLSYSIDLGCHKWHVLFCVPVGNVPIEFWAHSLLPVQHC